MFSSNAFDLGECSAPMQIDSVMADNLQPALNTPLQQETSTNDFLCLEGAVIAVPSEVEATHFTTLPHTTSVPMEMVAPANRDLLQEAMPPELFAFDVSALEQTFSSSGQSVSGRSTPSTGFQGVPERTPLSHRQTPVHMNVELPSQVVPCRSENSSERFCAVCGDEPSGKHYGAVCCDGCKGFFKRSFLSGQQYVCRHGSNCEIGVLNRNSCRACRLRKCLRVGMRILKSKDIDDVSNWFKPEKDMDCEQLSELRRIFLGPGRISLFQPAHDPRNKYRDVFSVQDISDAYAPSRDSFVQWAREALWSGLSLPDSVVLAEAGAGERFIIDILCRSQGKNYYDLGCGFLFTQLERIYTQKDVVLIFFASLSSTLVLVNELKVTDREFSYLRVLSYFNQPVENDQSRDKMRSLRIHFARSLEFELSAQKSEPARFAKLNLVLSRTVILSGKLFDLLSDVNEKGHTRMME